jgi:hypothetical protein
VTEAEKGKMDVDPALGEELEDLIKKVMDQPKEVLDRVNKMLDNYSGIHKAGRVACIRLIAAQGDAPGFRHRLLNAKT